MAEVIEYRDILKKHHIKVKSTNGNKTYFSAEGKTQKEAVHIALDASIQVISFYKNHISELQRIEINALFYEMLNDDY